MGDLGHRNHSGGSGCRLWDINSFRSFERAATRDEGLDPDDPVVIAAPADRPLGIGTAWAILFPMSRSVGMILSANLIDQPPEVASGATDATMRGSVYLANLFNEATIGNARESILHHPDDESLIPADLPAPRDKELDTSHRAADSDDDGSNPLGGTI